MSLDLNKDFIGKINETNSPKKDINIAIKFKIVNSSSIFFKFHQNILYRSNKNMPDTTRSCTICLESKSLINFEIHYNDECKHPLRTICDNCMYEYIQNIWNVNTDIQCPECSVLLSHSAIKQILFNYGDTILYERFTKFDLEKSLENNPEFIWCAHGCGSGQLNEGGPMNNPVQCVNCHHLTCFNHRGRWHDGMTCQEYDLPRNDGQKHASERWIDSHTKKCPKCPAHIEKNQGCDHMTCSKCKHEFCWECFAGYAKIKQHGPYLHYRTCKYYPTTETRTLFRRFLDLF